uniref:AT-rich interactive domain-containing protein 3 n=1 Tax=Anolis carolinensis TaxID=28377 RepID=H9GV00_ANOCA
GKILPETKAKRMHPGIALDSWRRFWTPVNRIPIMAKQVLDLYTLYRLVTEKGGLVEVINKKIWREITKGLNLPTSITSAAFTLRTQYMKYLYPYECDKRALSSPGELQAAIDSNRREGRRQTFGTALFSYSPVGTPGALFIGAWPSGHPRLPFWASLGGGASGGLAGGCAGAAAGRTLETGEPPEKKMALVAEEQQRLEAALNLSTNGISSINMSIEINGVVYTGKQKAPLAWCNCRRGNPISYSPPLGCLAI